MTGDPEIERQRLPQNWWERVLWLHGRRFWLATVAGVTIFVVALECIWLIATIPSVDRARLILEGMGDYFIAAVSIISVFSGLNTATDWIQRPGKTTTTTTTTAQPNAPRASAPSPRESGTVQPPAGEIL